MTADLVKAGLSALTEYVALHVLTCLVPAFLLAGAMVTFVSKEAIVHYMGASANKARSFSLAAAGSFFVAACSCTVIPVASGLYFGGAGIGPAFILLWVAPAANVLALVYTGAILGAEMVLVRLAAALIVAFLIGWVMTAAFVKEERQRLNASPRSEGDVALASITPGIARRDLGKKERLIERGDLILLVLLVATLLAPNYFIQQGPYLYKVYVWIAGMILVFGYAFWSKPMKDIKRWMDETWWFVRLIFPLLLVGVFVVGIIGALLPEVWIEDWLGGSSLLSAFLATLIGSVSYFATMTEAPFVDKLMQLGMGPGPALALLLTGPGISLPNWLAVARVFGLKKALVYVPAVIIVGTIVGWGAGKLIL